MLIVSSNGVETGESHLLGFSMLADTMVFGFEIRFVGELIVKGE
jgi:hypothetical protein